MSVYVFYCHTADYCIFIVYCQTDLVSSSNGHYDSSRLILFLLTIVSYEKKWDGAPKQSKREQNCMMLHRLPSDFSSLTKFKHSTYNVVVIIIINDI